MSEEGGGWGGKVQRVPACCPARGADGVWQQRTIALVIDVAIARESWRERVRANCVAPGTASRHGADALALEQLVLRGRRDSLGDWIK